MSLILCIPEYTSFLCYVLFCDIMGVSIPAKKHGKCPMCHAKNTVLTKHHEYLLDKKKGKIIGICDKCRKHYNQYFQYLQHYHNYKGRIR